MYRSKEKTLWILEYSGDGLDKFHIIFSGCKISEGEKKKLKTIWLYKLVLTFKCNRCVFLHYLCEYVCNNPSQKK